jgi:hypothetical protein
MATWDGLSTSVAKYRERVQSNGLLQTSLPDSVAISGVERCCGGCCSCCCCCCLLHHSSSCSLSIQLLTSGSTCLIWKLLDSITHHTLLSPLTNHMSEVLRHNDNTDASVTKRTMSINWTEHSHLIQHFRPYGLRNPLAMNGLWYDATQQ